MEKVFKMSSEGPTAYKVMLRSREKHGYFNFSDVGR